jgi:hypothetical protein
MTHFHHGLLSVALLSNESAVGRQDEVVAERRDRSPATIIDGTEDAQRTARTRISKNLHLELICSTRCAPQFSHLRRAEQRDQVTCRGAVDTSPSDA